MNTTVLFTYECGRRKKIFTAGLALTLPGTTLKYFSGKLTFTCHLEFLLPLQNPI